MKYKRHPSVQAELNRERKPIVKTLILEMNCKNKYL